MFASAYMQTPAVCSLIKRALETSKIKESVHAIECGKQYS